MPKIVAIGGGSLSKESPYSTTDINLAIIGLSGKQTPNVLFIPTASNDDPKYVDQFQQTFGNELGGNVDLLYLVKENTPIQQAADKIARADIIYVGGGNTLKMMNRWRARGIDQLLHQAHADNKVLCGTSAGSICWFAYGNSDSRKDKNPNASLIKVRGLGIIDALHCPHYDSEAERKDSLKNMMKKMPGKIAIALDDCAALVITDDHYTILTSISTANAYKVYWQRGQFYQELIIPSIEPTPLQSLLALTQ